MNGILLSLLQQTTPTAGAAQVSPSEEWFQTPLFVAIVGVVLPILLAGIGVVTRYILRDRKKEEAERLREEERRVREEKNSEERKRVQEAKALREKERAEEEQRRKEEEDRVRKDRMLVAVDYDPCTAKVLEYFIPPEGSTQVIRNVIQHIQRQEGTYIFDIAGLPGVGKTTILAHLYEAMKAYPDCNAVWLDMVDYDPSLMGEAGPVDTIAIRKNLVKYASFLNDLVRRLLARPAGSVLDGLEAFTIENEKNKINATNTVIARMQALRVSASNCRIVIFLEDTHKVISKPIAGYILHELIPNLPNTIVVLARQWSTDREHLDVAPRRVAEHELHFFSKSDIAAFIQKRLANIQAGTKPFDTDFFAKLVDTVHNFTVGYPQAVGLMGDVIAWYLSMNPTTQTEPTSADNLLQLLDLSSQDSDNAKRLMDLLDILDEIGLTPEMSSVLEVGCIVRRFDAALLCVMLNDSGDEDCSTDKLEAYNDAIENFRQFSFVSEYGDKYGFHEFVRAARQRKMLKAGPAGVARYNKLHDLAADYYSSQWFDEHAINKIGFLADTSSSRWKRYEEQEWWDLLKEWLYHLKQQKDRDLPWIDLLKVYLEGFSYWGFYARYDLCNILISEWSETQRTDIDQKRLAQLKAFHAEYPVGYEKRSKDDQWRTVERALTNIQRDLGLEKPIDQWEVKDQDKLVVRALISSFLAEAWRYGNWPGLDAAEIADSYYADAFNIYSNLGDEPDIFNTSYTGQEWAELCIERGDLAEAISKSFTSLHLANDNPEQFEMDLEEIQAACYITLGDACHALGADYLETAFLCYKWAVYHAYKYQAIPHQPDEYTALKYKEIKHRIINWLDMLWSNLATRSMAGDFAVRLATFWGDDAGLSDKGEIEARLPYESPGSFSSYFLPLGPYDINDWQATWVEDSAYDIRVKDVVRYVDNHRQENADKEAMWKTLEPLMSKSVK